MVRAQAVERVQKDPALGGDLNGLRLIVQGR
jgi:hypothetical protein